MRGVNLAAIYRNEGMIEQSVREAVRAVNSDYASASAHLFLSNSYNELRDPRRILLRYETPWFNELLPGQSALSRRWRTALAVCLAAGVFEIV